MLKNYVIANYMLQTENIKAVKSRGLHRFAYVYFKRITLKVSLHRFGCKPDQQL